MLTAQASPGTSCSHCCSQLCLPALLKQRYQKVRAEDEALAIRSNGQAAGDFAGDWVESVGR